MKSFIGISICFVVGLFACQQSVGQDVDQTASVVSVSENLVAKSECGQDCKTPIRNIVKDMGSNAVDMTKNTLCRARKMIRSTTCRAKCVTKRMASRARSFTKRVFSRSCCN